MQSEAKPRKIGTPFLITLIVLVVVAGILIWYYFVASGQISSLQTQLSSANTQISSLQSQNTNLQSIVDLSQSSTKASSVTLNQGAGQLTSVASFSASYAGYIVVSGTSTTTNGYIKVTGSYSGYPYNNETYSFGTGATLLIPVLPGTISVSFGSTNFINGATATITVVYYY